MRDNVEVGARLLDELSPGWHKEVSTSSLQMDSECNCILGQLYGDFTEGMVELFGRQHPHYASWLAGFDATDISYEALEDLWIEQVHSRLASHE